MREVQRWLPAGLHLLELLRIERPARLRANHSSIRQLPLRRLPRNWRSHC